MDNLKIYEAARAVPPEAQKSIQAGRLKGMTDINPVWRVKKLTELFGPCGVGWWYEIKDKQLIDDPATGQTAAFVDILLYYVDPESGAVSHAIPGTGGSSFVAKEKNGPYMSDECYKMALTDAISVAAKALGVGADVYWSRGATKYSEPAPKQPEEPPMFKCTGCGELIAPWITPDGKTKMGVRQIAQESEKQYGQRLCLKCISLKQKAAKAQAAANENAG